MKLRYAYNSNRALKVIMAFLLGSNLLLNSCTEPAPVSLSSEDRAIVDTLYSEQVQELRPRLDSLCEAIFDEEVQKTVDSMLVERRAEEERLRRRPAGEIDL